jgi:hypothetical protein
VKALMPAGPLRGRQVVAHQCGGRRHHRQKHRAKQHPGASTTGHAEVRAGSERGHAQQALSVASAPRRGAVQQPAQMRDDSTTARPSSA